MNQHTNLPFYVRLNAQWLYNGPYAQDITNTQGAELCGVADTTFARWRRDDNAQRHHAKSNGNQIAKPTEQQLLDRFNAELLRGWL